MSVNEKIIQLNRKKTKDRGFIVSLEKKCKEASRRWYFLFHEPETIKGIRLSDKDEKYIDNTERAIEFSPLFTFDNGYIRGNRETQISRNLIDWYRDGQRYFSRDGIICMYRVVEIALVALSLEK